jgi:hypothetical protein
MGFRYPATALAFAVTLALVLSPSTGAALADVDSLDPGYHYYQYDS